MNDDEVLYEQVSREMANGDIKEGMWTKAYANAMGDEGKAKAMYIRMRVEELAREQAVQESAALGVDEGEVDDEDGGGFSIKNIEEKIPPQVMNAVQLVVFIGGIIALWVFRDDVRRFGQWLRQKLTG